MSRLTVGRQAPYSDNFSGRFARRSYKGRADSAHYAIIDDFVQKQIQAAKIEMFKPKKQDYARSSRRFFGK